MGSRQVQVGRHRIDSELLTPRAQGVVWGPTPTLNGRFRAACAATLALIAVPFDLGAQAVSGTVLSAADGQPVPYGTISVGDTAEGRFADAAGRFSLGAPATGTYRLRAQQVGFLPLDTTLSAGGGSQHLVLRLQPLPVRLANIPAESPQHGCAPQLAGSGASPAVAMILAQVRQNAERYRILLDQYPFNYRLEESRAIQLAVHTRDEQDSVIAFDTAMYDSRQRHQYSIGSVIYEQRSVSGGKRVMMFIPTLSDLADPAFAGAHCYAYAGDAAHELRIEFRPADMIKAPDVTGSIYLDDARYVVKRAVFNLTHAGAVGGAAPYVKVTATFREEVPFVPMLVSSRTEQPLANVTTGGLQSVGSLADQGAKNVGGFQGISGKSEQRVSIQQDLLLDHTFIGDTIGSQGQAHAPGRSSGFVINVACTMPPSFETADVLVYGTLAGPSASDARASDVLAKVRALFHMPNDFTLPVYGYSVGSKATQTLTAQVAFTLDATGHATGIAVTATSLSPSIDSNVVAAIRDADPAHAFRALKAGRYTLSLSSAAPSPDAPASILFARIAASVMSLARTAELDPDSTQPRLSVNGRFEFVVDEQGRAVPTTLFTPAASPDALASAARVLPAFRFRPALAGSCPVKQEVMLTGLRQ
jgi:hypothetical protein